jgi:hypothetical protein
MINSEKPLISSRSAAVLSLILCLPFLLIFVTEVYDLQALLPIKRLLTLDGFQPTLLGRLLMIGMLICLPLAFLVNLLPMIRRRRSEQATSFKLTAADILVGMSLLALVLMTVSHGVLYELRPFVKPLGPAASVGQILFLLGLLALPMAFLLDRLPWVRSGGSSRIITFQPTSINLIVGATILLAMLMTASGFLLETIACSIGVPNCD